MKKTVKYLPKAFHNAHFFHRDTMKQRAQTKSMRLPQSPPATTLPVDCTGNATVKCPMDGNDQLGDCGEAMVAHVDNILTFRQGKGVQSVFDVKALERQYEQVSGGDNGLDEDMTVNQIWKMGIAGDRDAIIVDSLDIDVKNEAMAQFAIDQFYAVCLAWSVPDSFIQNFQQGAVFDAPGRPDPNNGHYTPLSDIDASGRYRLWTWGAWCWVSAPFVASVEPQAFVAFSPRQFDPKTGLDSKGRHIRQQATLWHQVGGDAIPESVLSSFPAPGPAPAPSPSPSPGPSPAPAPSPVSGFWEWIITTVKLWVKELGVLAIPLIDQLVSKLPLPEFVIAAIEAIIAAELGANLRFNTLARNRRQAG